jgi:glycosyltransferase involved in cell wall biosynthesis
MSDDIKQKYQNILSDKKIKYHGPVNYKTLIKLMFNSHILVFPSRVEGSARVIPEAMASGCAIITTINSGSVVKNKKNGIIVKSGESKKLAEAMNKFIKHPKLIKYYGLKNQILINRKYNLDIYGKKID